MAQRQSICSGTGKATRGHEVDEKGDEAEKTDSKTSTSVFLLGCCQMQVLYNIDS